MGFFRNLIDKINKKKIIPNDYGRTLNRGILFEDSNRYIQWMTPINDVVKNLNPEINKPGDRTTFIWGKHKILKGLELTLITEFWDFGDEMENRRFNKIEYLVVGDDIAINGFDMIFKHLCKNYSEPIKKEIIDGGESFCEWMIDDVKMTLYLFEMHCFRLSFKIEKKTFYPINTIY
jgi:hypothetical protein